MALVPLLVDLTAPWCGPCELLAPVLDELLTERSGAIRGVKIDIDEAAWTEQRFGFQGVPTVILFQQGREILRSTGVRPKYQIAELLDTSLRNGGQRSSS